jgi:hypothetical protein
MITWRNRSIESLTAAELRIALEDAAAEMLRAREAFGPGQFFNTLLVGFAAGAVTAASAAFLVSLIV